MSADDRHIVPVVVSQDSCAAAYGVSSSWYLDRANAGAFPCWRVGGHWTGYAFESYDGIGGVDEPTLRRAKAAVERLWCGRRQRAIMMKSAVA